MVNGSGRAQWAGLRPRRTSGAPMPTSARPSADRVTVASGPGQLVEVAGRVGGRDRGIPDARGRLLPGRDDGRSVLVAADHADRHLGTRLDVGDGPSGR